MHRVTDTIPLSTLKKMAQNSFGTLVKAVVDIEKEILVVDGELHADEEALLLSQGSKQEHIWGLNIYPDLEEDQWIEFDSMINLRPSSKNLTRGVEDRKLQEKIRKIVQKRVIR